jgi:ubiquitin-activating enzyme E1 C
MSTLSLPNEAPATVDWPGRYYHIDQVLNTPGPRTDPAFLAGDGVDAPSRFGSFQLY